MRFIVDLAIAKDSTFSKPWLRPRPTKPSSELAQSCVWAFSSSLTAPSSGTSLHSSSHASFIIQLHPLNCDSMWGFDKVSNFALCSSVICLMAGVVALLLLPLLAKNTYISENALMPGYTHFHSYFQIIATSNFCLCVFTFLPLSFLVEQVLQITCSPAKMSLRQTSWSMT